MASVIALGIKLLELRPGLEYIRAGTRKDRKQLWKGITLRTRLRPEDQTEILGDDKYMSSRIVIE